MSLTVQKLQRRLRELRQAAEERENLITPVATLPAEGPMASPPPANDERWQNLESGQIWGLTHGTCWLQANLAPHTYLPDQAPVLQLRWDQEPEDTLFRHLEASVFLDGKAAGAFDWRHPLLALPQNSSAGKVLQSGRSHRLTIQVYTRQPIPFAGLFLLTRYEQVYRLYQMMQTLLDVCLGLDEHEPARHRLLEKVNQAYTLLDLREGWRSERLRASVPQALELLEAGIDDLPERGARPSITISGHAHLDVAWLWPYWRTHQKIAHTVSTALALMERYPDYHYSQSQPQLLQWLKEDAPELYARVKERVAEGRFEPVGAMWVESDCNLTSGESLIRQIMHGTRFLHKEFGITPRLIWLPDVFGYSAALPQIMRSCNIPCFMTTKISWNQFNRLPVDTFRWRGIDGAEVLTHFITAPSENDKSTSYTYNGPLQPSDMLGTWRDYQQQALNDQFLYLGGWGDGGGGPEEDQLERAQVMADLPAFPKVRMGRVDAYFDDLYQRLWEDQRLPTWVGELYLEYHRGTYTSQAHTKQANRRMELLYRDVELLNAWASLYGAPSRQETLNEGWKLILLNQFHDVLPGSSIHEVYEDVAKIYAGIQELAEPVRAEMLATLSARLGTDDGGRPALLLLNTLPWERSEPLQLPGDHTELLPNAQLASNWEGHPLTLLDGQRLPSCGALLTAVTRQQPDAPAASLVTASDGRVALRNAFYELNLNELGEISRLYDREAGREVIAPGQSANQLIAYEDRPLNFDAWDIDLYYEEKPYPLQEGAQIRLLEEGPVRATVEVERQFLSSRITQRISLWRTSRRIDFATEIDWHERQMLLKTAFPVAINATRATYEIQFGSVERPTHRNTSWDWARFEVCAHRWADLSEGGYGVSLLNDSKYGHDIHDNVMRLTLLKSAIVPDPEADQGLHRFTYSLLPHQGDWRAAQTVRRAYELNVPALVKPGFLPEGQSEPVASSFLSTDCPHVVIDTVKPAEDGQGLIVRLYEAHNQRGNGTLTFATPLLSAMECNPLEETLGKAAYQGNTLSFQVRPFEIKSFRVQLAQI
ncbi:MAG TPA: alpha-mannosidase [Ktedonobacteraceae bacterium]|nr:alpha-mannosidase [Ktedonobacteraceae bacterium]